jgi:heme exporter protein A
MLELTGVCCARGGLPLLSDIHLRIAPGQCWHLSGPNGSGKTTLLRLMAGLTPVDAGSICWGGLPLGAMDSEFKRQRLYLGHTNALQESATVAENLHFQAALQMQALERSSMEDLLVRHHLLDCIDKPVKHLSQGQKRRAAMVRLEISPARLWLLDEPLVALDQAAIARLGLTLDHHLSVGGMVVFTSHQHLPLQSNVQEWRLGS